MNAVEATGLVKIYGDQRVVDGIDLAIPRGSFYGIAGPNGAGKTTVIKMVIGLLRPNAGQRRGRRRRGVAGHDRGQASSRLRARQPGAVRPSLGAGDARVRRSAARPRTCGDPARPEEMLRILGLTPPRTGRSVTTRSGMTKRMGLAVALLHAPRVLVLDEPFGSLDPVNTQVMEEMLQRYRKGGGTVVFSSHVMEVVERLCDRVVIIEQGAVRAEGTVARAGRRPDRCSRRSSTSSVAATSRRVSSGGSRPRPTEVRPARPGVQQRKSQQPRRVRRSAGCSPWCSASVRAPSPPLSDAIPAAATSRCSSCSR